MKHLFLTLLATLCAATGYGQTMKALSYNASNGVVSAPSITFTSQVSILGVNIAADGMIQYDGNDVLELSSSTFLSAVQFAQPAATRTNLGLGATNTPAFRGLTSDGNIVIANQSAATNGLLFVYRTNNEPFLGMANLIASNNTTISNETLFRVGVAEATNKAAQFGFRVTRTNNGGEGVAVFSVFGYNALMMIGPSDRSRTNTATNAAIEADIWTISTNRVATLRDTNSGAFTLHQELGFSTGGITTNAPANTTNVALWLRVWVGTNNYRLPLYQ
jgi:hypothetical protein